jgi:TonB family protein
MEMPAGLTSIEPKLTSNEFIVVTGSIKALLRGNHQSPRGSGKEQKSAACATREQSVMTSGLRVELMRTFGQIMQLSKHSRMFACVWLLAAGCAGPPPQPALNSAVTDRYGHTLHDRFYEAWQQPAAVRLPTGQISVPVDVTIDNTGRVVGFRIVKPSGNIRIDNSIAAVEKTVRQVAPPPGIAPGKIFRLRIYFELDVTR